MHPFVRSAAHPCFCVRAGTGFSGAAATFRSAKALAASTTRQTRSPRRARRGPAGDKRRVSPVSSGRPFWVRVQNPGQRGIVAYIRKYCSLTQVFFAALPEPEIPPVQTTDQPVGGNGNSSGDNGGNGSGSGGGGSGNGGGLPNCPPERPLLPAPPEVPLLPAPGDQPGSQVPDTTPVLPVEPTPPDVVPGEVAPGDPVIPGDPLFVPEPGMIF